MMNAVVLAGGPPDAVAALAAGAVNKAFVPIDGMTLVARTIAALRSSPLVGRIRVVAPPRAFADPALDGADERRPDGRRISESLLSGLADWPGDEAVLVSASDLPILTRAAIDEFVELAERRDADVAYACLERHVHLAHFPDVPHTWARLRDGTFCGAGLIAIKPRVVPQLLRFLESLGAARKNPLRLARVFGMPVLVRYALGRLSIADAEGRASALLGARAAAIVCTHPEIAVNVDRPSDVPLAERLVRRGTAAMRAPAHD